MGLRSVFVLLLLFAVVSCIRVSLSKRAKKPLEEGSPCPFCKSGVLSKDLVCGTCHAYHGLGPKLMCPMCGLPNKPTSDVCAYCFTDLPKPKPLASKPFKEPTPAEALAYYNKNEQQFPPGSKYSKIARQSGLDAAFKLCLMDRDKERLASHYYDDAIERGNAVCDTLKDSAGPFALPENMANVRLFAETSKTLTPIINELNWYDELDANEAFAEVVAQRQRFRTCAAEYARTKNIFSLPIGDAEPAVAKCEETAQEARTAAAVNEKDTALQLVQKYNDLAQARADVVPCFRKALGDRVRHYDAAPKGYSINDNYAYELDELSGEWSTACSERQLALVQSMTLAQLAVLEKLAVDVHALWVGGQKVDNAADGNCFFYAFLDSFYRAYVGNVKATTWDAIAQNWDEEQPLEEDDKAIDEKGSIAAQLKNRKVMIGRFRSYVAGWLRENRDSERVSGDVGNHREFRNNDFDFDRAVDRIESADRRIFAETAEITATADLFNVHIVLCTYNTLVKEDAFTDCSIVSPISDDRIPARARQPVIIVNAVTGQHFTTVNNGWDEDVVDESSKPKPKPESEVVDESSKPKPKPEPEASQSKEKQEKNGEVDN